ncbi:MAG TPA: DNA methyltransferase [Steroidobacteraceae bacterium]|nr:DNA methyltransferase [Steroidobacteraceae bacterium]
MPERPQLAVIYRPLADLIPYARNARTHSPEQVAQIAASMEQFGWTNPILVDERGGVIAGHGRLQAAQALGMGQVPTIAVPGLTEAQRRALVLADNKLALNAGWDFGLLRDELAELDTGEFDMGVLGFSGEELEQIATWTPDGSTSSYDDGRANAIPAAPTRPVSGAGDVWLLGRHRLMCADCRDPAQAATLLSTRRINLAFTSPPYAEQREYDRASGFLPVKPIDYVDWFAPVAAIVATALEPDGSWFVNIKPPGAGLDTDLYVFDLVIAHVRKWGWHFATEFCWERNGVPKSVTQRFKNQFEPVYQFTRGRWKMRPDAVRHESDNVPRAGGKGVGDTSWATAQGNGGPIFGAARKRKRGTTELMSGVQGLNAAPGEYIGPGLAYPGNRLPTFTSSHEALGHAAAFPVGLPEFFIKAYTDEGDAVFDPFLGTGSTLIAAECTERDGYGMELSPAYVDVCVTRWQNFTGKQATLESDGRTFAEIALERSPGQIAA